MTDPIEQRLRRMAEAGPAADSVPQPFLDRLERLPLPPQKRPLSWWPAALTDELLAPAWPRVAALAAAAVLGISIGLSGLGTRIATDLDIVRVASADDANVFDLDVGLRP